MNYLGDYAEDSTVRIFFTTHTKEGGEVAPSNPFENSDVAIYKNGSATQKATANGLTMTSPFDGIIGLHLLEIDTNVDTGDVGFWAAGGDYSVVLYPDETVDGETVVKVIGSFSLERAGASLALLKNGAYGLSALEALVDDLETRVGTPSNLGSGATLAANLVDIEGQTDDIGVAGAGLTAIPISSTSVDAILDDPVEGAITLRQAMRVLLAYLAGRATGGGTANPKFRDQANTKNRISMTVDASGNRSAVTLDLT